MRTMNKSYGELISFDKFSDRLKYLSLQGAVGAKTFGGHRSLNQMLYKFPEWKRVRREVILRDDGFDLGHPEHPIGGVVYVHHINPITIEDILNRDPIVFDLRNLISCSFQTHNQIHYGDGKVQNEFVERRENDTCLWR